MTSFVRDDLDFLNKIPKQISDDKSCTLVTFDVDSLYTNIDHDLGLDAVKHWIEKYKQDIPDRFTTEFICDCIKLILKNNTFHFNGKYYVQTKGTAMGTKMAPNYANMAIAFIEERMYNLCETNYSQEYTSYIKANWKRYLDDCVIIWDDRYEISDFHNILNSLHKDINFTVDKNKHTLPFLDIQVNLPNNEINTDVYYKSTDTHQYLSYKSCHPRHTKTNISYSLARRICTIVDEPTLRDKRLDELKQFLLGREYPIAIIEHGIKQS